jgi:hypothetical protein
MSEPTRHVSKTGGAKDLKIERYDQIPAGPLAELAARYGVGSLKYDQVNGLDNWRNGYQWSWSYRALLGHANAFWAGEDVDPAAYAGTDDPRAIIDGVPRPGTSHLAAVAWHAFALLEWLETHPELDDRPSTVVRRNEAGVAPTEERLTDDEKSEEFYNGWQAAMRHVGWSDPDPESNEAGVAPTEEIEPAPLLDGWPLLIEHTGDDGSFIRTYIPNPKITDNGNGSYSIAARLVQKEPTLELDDQVELRLPDAPVRTGAISGIRKVDGQIRYDVNYDTAYYGLCGQVNRATFVNPKYITKL